MNQCGIKKKNIRITLLYQKAYFRAAQDNLRCDLMHGIRTYGNKIRPRLFQPPAAWARISALLFQSPSEPDRADPG